MPVLHMFLRREATPVQFPEVTLQFKPNEQGDVVCDVPEGSMCLRLLDIKEAYRLYPVQPSPAVPIDPAPGAVSTELHPYMLVNGDQTLDLRTMTDEQLHAFAKENNIAVHPNAKGNTIRNKIVAGLSVDEGEQAPTEGEGAQ